MIRRAESVIRRAEFRTRRLESLLRRGRVSLIRRAESAIQRGGGCWQSWPSAMGRTNDDTPAPLNCRSHGNGMDHSADRGRYECHGEGAGILLPHAYLPGSIFEARVCPSRAADEPSRDPFLGARSSSSLLRPPGGGTNPAPPDPDKDQRGPPRSEDHADRLSPP